MRENGSPAARFDFDAEQRTYFRVTLPVHPRYLVLHALREGAHLWAIGDRRKAADHLERALEHQPGSGALAAQLIEFAHGLDDTELARRVLERFDNAALKTEGPRPYLTEARHLIDMHRVQEAKHVLTRMPTSRAIDDIIETAILKKRSRDFQGAHSLFAEAYGLKPDDPKVVQEFAQTKIQIARQARPAAIKRRLNNEAAELLRRAIQLSDDPIRTAWCWFDLAQTLEWLRAPSSEVETAFLKALSLRPTEPKFERAYKQWKEKTRTKGD